jgi:hypothetical protein
VVIASPCETMTLQHNVRVWNDRSQLLDERQLRVCRVLRVWVITRSSLFVTTTFAYGGNWRKCA